MSRVAPDLDLLVAELSDDETERETMRRTLRLLPYAAAPAAPHVDLKSRILARVNEGSQNRGPAFVDGFSCFARGDERIGFHTRRELK